MSFKKLGLSDLTLKAIEEIGYTEPTPIQNLTIPHILQGKDVVGIAQTGTGKTAAFVLPMLEILAEGQAKARMPRAVILSPTRELSSQIGENFAKYGKYHKLSMALLIGGESVTEQKRILSSDVDVLIATPGRMIDMFERGQLIMTGVKIVVIDEADRMLDMGFIPSVKKILSWIKKTRQTLLFSATMDKEIQEIAEKFMLFPKEIFASPPSLAAQTINHTLVYASDPTRKRNILCDIINSEKIKNAMLFCNHKTDVSRLYNLFRGLGYSVCQFHGDMSQSDRRRAIEAFKNGFFSLLVCSDAAARGLDLPDVSHVFLYDVPFKPEDYVHRIGRTGRAGKAGKAFTLVCDNDSKMIAAIEKNMGQRIDLNYDFGDSFLYNESKFAGTERKYEKCRLSVSFNSKAGTDQKRRTKKGCGKILEKHKGTEILKRRDISKQRSLHDANAYTCTESKNKRKRASTLKGTPLLAFGGHIPAFFGKI